MVDEIFKAYERGMKPSAPTLLKTVKGQRVALTGLGAHQVYRYLNRRTAGVGVHGVWFTSGSFVKGGSKKLKEKFEKDRKAAGMDNNDSDTLEARKAWAKEWSEKNIPLTKKAIAMRQKISKLGGHSLVFDPKKDVTEADIQGGFASDATGLAAARAVGYAVKKDLIEARKKILGDEERSHYLKITASEQKEEEERVQKVLRNFREQGYLVVKMQELAKYNVSTGYTYKNYAYLRSQPLSGPLTSQLQAIGAAKLAPLLNLKNEQLSALTPMFRLYKIDKKNKKKGIEELKLQGNYHSIENNSLESIGRSGRLGLKSFTWTYDGKYRSTADKMIRGDLTLYGDSLTVFDEKIHDDLLVPRSGEWYAQVGWAPPPNNAGGLFSKEEISALRNSLITLWMGFKIPQFTFKQDGTFELNLTFRSAIMQALNNVDIFGPTNAKEELLNVSSAFRSKVMGSFTKFLEKREKSLKNGKYGVASSAQASLGLGPVGKGGSPAKIKAIDTKAFNTFKSETLLRAGIQPGQLSRAQNLIDTFMKRKEVEGDLDYAWQFSDRMHHLIERKRSNKVFRRILEDIENKKRKFYVTTTASEFDKFYKDFGPLDATVKDITPEEYEAMKKKNPPPPSVPKKPTGAPGSIPKTEVKTSLKGIKPDEISVAFVYFGDIIESVFSNTAYQVPDKEKVNFILSTLAYRDYFIEGNRGMKSVMAQIPIVDMPISVNYFTKWFHDEYIVKVSEKVTLDEFLNKALKTLLLPAMGPDNFRASFKNHAMSPHQFSWTADKKANQPPRGEINFDTLKGLVYQGSMSTRPISYVVYSSWIYAEDEKMKSSKGTIHTSTTENIVLHLAKDHGLLKDVTFSRNNLPHWEADQIRNDKITSNFEKIRIPYAVEVKMIGNNLFFPGTHFEVYPTIPGSRARAIAEKLGLGGRYQTHSITNRIEPETGFTTEFTAQNVLMADSIKKGKKKTPRKRGKPIKK